MAENTIPWWRKALSIALEGIRTGFGLFARPPQKAEAEAAEEARPVAPSAAPEPARALDAAALYELSRAKKHKTNKERQKNLRLKATRVGQNAAAAIPSAQPVAAAPAKPTAKLKIEPTVQLAPRPMAATAPQLPVVASVDAAETAAARRFEPPVPEPIPSNAAEPAVQPVPESVELAEIIEPDQIEPASAPEIPQIAAVPTAVEPDVQTEALPEPVAEPAAKVTASLPEPAAEPEQEPEAEIVPEPAAALETFERPASEAVEEPEPQRAEHPTSSPEPIVEEELKPEAEPEPEPEVAEEQEAVTTAAPPDALPDPVEESESEAASEQEPEAVEQQEEEQEGSLADEDVSAAAIPVAELVESSVPESAHPPVENIVEDSPLSVEEVTAPALDAPAGPAGQAVPDNPERVEEAEPEPVRIAEPVAAPEAPAQPAAEAESQAEFHALLIRQKNTDICFPPIPAKNAGMDGAPSPYLIAGSIAPLPDVYPVPAEAPVASAPETPEGGDDEPCVLGESAEYSAEALDGWSEVPIAELADEQGEEPSGAPTQEPEPNTTEISTAESLPEPVESEPALERMEEMEVSPNLMPASEATSEVLQQPAVEPAAVEAVPVLSEPEAPESAAEPAEEAPAASGAESATDVSAIEAPAPELPALEVALPEAPAEQEAPAAAAEEPATPAVAEEPAAAAEAQPEPPAPEASSESAVAQPASAQPAELPEDAEPTPSAESAAEAKPSHPMIHREVTDDMPFALTVNNVYDGPLDLLLDLIRKQDIDIYDIPIAKITAQFLAYVNKLKSTDVDTAGEFIYMASLLIHIKSKMLLPRTPTGQDDAAEDPRRELVERLLEHERFKNAAQMLLEKQMLEAATWTNPGAREFRNDETTETEIAADTTDLVRIFRDILDRARNRPVINVEEDSVTVGQMIQFLSRRLTMEDKPVALRRLLSHTRSERALIAMFLALLELVRLQAILLRQDSAFSDIFIKKHTGFEAVMDQGTANMHDDWR
jgi:segregation and condensation protein A